MYLLPHANHACDVDTTTVYSLFLTYYNIAYLHVTTAMLVDCTQWGKCIIYKANEVSLIAGIRMSSSYKLSLPFTMKFPHHLSIAANTITITKMAVISRSKRKK